MECTATEKFIQIYGTSSNDVVLTAFTDSWFEKDYVPRLATDDLVIEAEKATLLFPID